MSDRQSDEREPASSAPDLKGMKRRDLLLSGSNLLVASAFLAPPTAFAPTVAMAQDGQEPLGGQPPKGATPSVKDFDYQIKYQRAFEAVLWSMPAVAIYSFRRVGIQRSRCQGQRHHRLLRSSDAEA